MARPGFTVRPDRGGYVSHARDLREAAWLVADLYPDAARVKACVSLTRGRELTDEEVRELADLAAAIITTGDLTVPE